MYAEDKRFWPDALPLTLEAADKLWLSYPTGNSFLIPQAPRNCTMQAARTPTCDIPPLLPRKPDKAIPPQHKSPWEKVCFASALFCHFNHPFERRSLAEFALFRDTPPFVTGCIDLASEACMVHRRCLRPGHAPSLCWHSFTLCHPVTIPPGVFACAFPLLALFYTLLPR